MFMSKIQLTKNGGTLYHTILLFNTMHVQRHVVVYRYCMREGDFCMIVTISQLNQMFTDIFLHEQFMIIYFACTCFVSIIMFSSCYIIGGPLQFRFGVCVLYQSMGTKYWYVQIKRVYCNN